MQYYIDPQRRKKTINFKDGIVYKTVTDLDGNKLDLTLSIMSMSGNSELKAAAADAKETDKVSAQPAIVWVSGGGYRGVDKNQMIAEIQYLAAAGYAIVMVYYRSSAQGKWPAQIIDTKTAIRFIRANAKELLIDPDHIGIMGRSAGGHIASIVGMNIPGYDDEDYSGYSSDVQAVINNFGPVNLCDMYDYEKKNIESNPNYRWHNLMDTHGGAVMGGDEETLYERSKAATAIYLMDKMTHPAPLLIFHGDADKIVPHTISTQYYNALVEAGYEDQTDYYVIKGAGHGTPEFFQPQVKDISLNFFIKYLGEGQK